VSNDIMSELSMHTHMTTETGSRPHSRKTMAPRAIIETMDVNAPSPGHINPIEWHQSMGLARQACARIFRDGGTPADALAAFGVAPGGDVDWSRAVDIIAEALSTPALRRAA
jgi:hypothetical protein